MVYKLKLVFCRDNVEWDDEQDQQARSSVANNSAVTLSEAQVEKYESDAGKFWDSFYDVHQNRYKIQTPFFKFRQYYLQLLFDLSRFFKDRHWLFTEFPELSPDYTGPGEVSTTTGSTNSADDASSSIDGRRIFELGCGVGNTIFPILKYSKDPTLRVFGCDFSSTAIEIMNSHAEFDQERCKVFVMDATAEQWTVPFSEGSMDFIILIFVLSAIHPDK